MEKDKEIKELLSEINADVDSIEVNTGWINHQTRNLDEKLNKIIELLTEIKEKY